MNFYKDHHKFYSGIYLHAIKMYLSILDEKGDMNLPRNIPLTGQIKYQEKR
jgi:hypothetical protein